MHAPIARQMNATDRLVKADGSYDLSEIMRFAWAKLANNRRLCAERSRLGYNVSNLQITFGEALRDAWARAVEARGRQSDLRQIAERGSLRNAPIATRRLAAECCEGDARRRAELDRLTA